MPQRAVIACGLLIILAGWSGAHYIDQKQPQLSLSSISQVPDDWYPRGSSSFKDFPGCIADPEYRVVNGATLMLYTPHGCVQPRPLQERVLYVIGDSHAMAYEGLFKQYAIEQSIRVHAYVKSGCAFISLQPWNNDAACRQFARDVLSDLATLKAGDVLSCRRYVCPGSPISGPSSGWNKPTTACLALKPMPGADRLWKKPC